MYVNTQMQHDAHIVMVLEYCAASSLESAQNELIVTKKSFTRLQSLSICRKMELCKRNQGAPTPRHTYLTCPPIKARNNTSLSAVQYARRPGGMLQKENQLLCKAYKLS